MDKKKIELIDLLIKESVLCFGSFTTNSGRISPYFFNMGRVCSAKSLYKLACYYSEIINPLLSKDKIGYIFGPSYKGIPLAVGIAQYLSHNSLHDVKFSFDRKEAKDHGEGGVLVGHVYTGQEDVIIVEDVLTSGKSIRKSISLLKNYGVRVRNIVVCIDRQEIGINKQQTAKFELQQELGVSVHSLLTIKDIVSYLELDKSHHYSNLERIRAYISS
jgi:orotate phosphoribosyltransferase